MFANENFIEASRKFVCIRIESYESEESEKMVRELLNGRFANTSFCLFNPQGTQRLSRSGRGPGDLGQGRSKTKGEGDDEAVIREMNRIAARYHPNENNSDAVLQDFDSFRQALNVASADQRLLIFITSDDESLVENLRTSLLDEELVGKFHLDFGDAKTDQKWAANIRGVNDKARLFIIRSGKFGTTGEVMEQLSEDVSVEKITEALKNCNEKFASVETRKTYRDHVIEGRRKGVYFENAIPYGEDRKSDGNSNRKGRGQRGQRAK